VTQKDVEDHNNKVIDLTPIRKKYKVANYSCVYGVGAVKLARESKLTKKEAQKLIDDYWARNWSIKKVAADCEVKVTGQSMWLKNPVSGFWYQLRSDRDRFSTLNQSTGVYCFDTWLAYVRKLGVEPVMQFHDEQGNYLDIGAEEENSNLLRKAIKMTNDKLKLNVPLGIDIKYGKTYAEVH
jgi:DNA polymerase I-like protein with 3'-5' exonuclease and polymerase domains